ncbi:MAG: LysM peptidoglycan-binding domain-containing protein [Weeksellaceae bacterium]|nr:LysM peptidoglycan-binding domain-containing protein [Weeksellaceae bacterium]
MKNLFYICVLMLGTLGFAQQITHTVKAQETVYGLSRQYNITPEQLENANPFLKQRGLQIGDVLVIPGQVQSSALATQEGQDYEDDNFYYRYIKPKQTVFSITREYSIEEATLKSLNPFIDQRGLQVGDLIRIPKRDAATAQEVVPDGMHKVVAGETIFSIARNYGLEVDDLYAANRSVQTEGLKAGSFIRIPDAKTVVIKQDYFEHTVSKNETVFGLINKYEITMSELIAMNPSLEEGLKEGSTIMIPMKKGAKIASMPSAITMSATNKSDNEINLLWIMPFQMGISTASAGERQVAQDFFMGAQIALDDMVAKGKKINVKVIDSEKDIETIDEYLQSPEFQKTDAIIGPFFQDLLIHVAQRLENTNVPVFSPIVNNEGLENLKNLHLAQSRDDSAVSVIVDEVKKNFKKEKIIVYTDSQNLATAEVLRAELLKNVRNSEVEIVQNVSQLNLKEIRTPGTLEDGTEGDIITYEPIIAILATDSNQAGANFVREITAQNKDYISGYSLYFVPALDVFDTANQGNINKLKDMGFTYTANRMVNTMGVNEKRIISLFEKKFCQRPNRFMATGYDVVYDVLDRMDKHGNISDFDAKRVETRFSTRIGYQKSPNGPAKVNRELRTIRLGH